MDVLRAARVREPWERWAVALANAALVRGVLSTTPTSRLSETYSGFRHHVLRVYDPVPPQRVEELAEMVRMHGVARVGLALVHARLQELSSGVSPSGDLVYAFITRFGADGPTSVAAFARWCVTTASITTTRPHHLETASRVAVTELRAWWDEWGKRGTSPPLAAVFGAFRLDESRDSMVRTASGPGAPREDLLRLWRAGALGYRPSLKSPEWVRPENDARGEDLLEIVDASLDVLSLGACREGPASRHRRSSAALIAQVFADGETPVETNRLKDHAPHARRWRLILIRIMDTEMSQCAAEMAYLEFRRHWSDLRADHPPPELCVECAEGEGALMELLGHVRSERGRPFIE